MGKRRPCLRAFTTGFVTAAALAAAGACPGVPVKAAPAAAAASAVASGGQARGAPVGLPPGSLWVAGVPADEAGPSLLVDGTLLIPARVLEQLEVRVEWRTQDRAVWMRRGERWALATVGSRWMQTDSGTVALAQSAEIMGGRLVVPARAVGEALGLTIRWDARAKRAYLDARPEPSPDASPPAASGRGQEGELAPPASRVASASGSASSRPASARAYQPSPRPPPPATADVMTAGALVALLPAPIGPTLQRPALLPDEPGAPAPAAPLSSPSASPSAPGAVARDRAAAEPRAAAQAQSASVPVTPPSPQAAPEVATAPEASPPGAPSGGPSLSQQAGTPGEAAQPAAPAGATPPAPVPSPVAPASPEPSPKLPPFQPRPLQGLLGALSHWALSPQTPALAPGLERSGVLMPAGLVSLWPAPLRELEGKFSAVPAQPAPKQQPVAAGSAGELEAVAGGTATQDGRELQQDRRELAQDGREPVAPAPTRPQALSQILGVQVRRTGGRPRVEVLRDGPVTLAQPAILADPPRLVFDLAGARLAAPALEYDVDGPVVRRVRLGQQAPDVVRVAVDLNALVGFTLAEGSESTTVFINHQVAGVRWIPDPPSARSPAGGQLWIEMSGYAPIRTSVLDNPRRLIFDIHEATLTVPASEWAISSGPVTRVRVSQNQPDVVRVVLELAAPVAPRFVTSADLARRGLEGGGGARDPAPDAGGGLAAAGAAAGRAASPAPGPAGAAPAALPASGPAQGATSPATAQLPAPGGPEAAVPLDVVLDVYSRIRRVSLTTVSRTGVSLMVEATGPLQPRTLYLRDPDRLVVDFAGAVLEPQAGGPQGEFAGQGPVRVLRTGQFLPRAARLVLELDSPVAHRLFRSEEGSVAVVALGSEPLVGRTVAIDPGHGGVDSGAMGLSSTPEKFYNLDVARRLAGLLESLGVQVTMTRADDVYVSLDERVEIARRAGAEVLVSVHHNASTSGLGMGTEVLYAPRLPASRMLAELLYDALVSQLQTQGRGVKARSDLRVLRLAPMPAALVEVAFVDHPADEKRLQDPAFRQSAAEALFSGIVSFFSSMGNANTQEVPERRPAVQVVGRLQ